MDNLVTFLNNKCWTEADRMIDAADPIVIRSYRFEVSSWLNFLWDNQENNTLKILGFQVDVAIL